MAINAADIVAEFGAVYIDEGQSARDLINPIFRTEHTNMLFAQQMTNNTQLRKATAQVTSVLQRFQKTFTPKGDTTFQPRTIDLFKLKIDEAEYPDDLEENWLSFLASNSTDRKTWPFIKWWMETLIIPKSIEDFEENEWFLGVPGAINPGTPTADGTNILGIRKQINDDITSGDIAATYSTGALSSDPVTLVEQIEDFFDQLPEKERGFVRKLALRESKHTLYKRGMREKYNMNYEQAGSLTTIIDTRVEVVGMPGMGSSDKIFCTVEGNLVDGYKKPENRRAFQVENVDRQVKIYTDFYRGLGYWNPAWVYTNDQDLV